MSKWLLLALFLTSCNCQSYPVLTESQAIQRHGEIYKTQLAADIAELDADIRGLTAALVQANRAGLISLETTKELSFLVGAADYEMAASWTAMFHKDEPTAKEALKRGQETLQKVIKKVENVLSGEAA